MRLSTLGSYISNRSRLQFNTKMSSAGQKRIESFFTSTATKKQKKEDGETSKAAAGASGSSEQPAPKSPTALAPGVDIHQQQVTVLQTIRANANKNNALAKQVVIKAETTGSVPALSDLIIEESWRTLLQDEIQKPYFRQLETFVQGAWNGSKPVFPPKDAVFRAFNSCPVNSVRVVILGQDPYHDIGQAMGLSFSVPKDKKIPSSLRNMYKEMKEDLGCPVPTHGNLEKWAHQGVLLLNAVLTVQAHTAASHGKKGWEKFTDEAVARLSRERTGIVFLLWGRYAQEKGKVIDTKRHHVLTAAHPSGLSASRGFFGCRHFSKANELLEKDGQVPIDWCIE